MSDLDKELDFDDISGKKTNLPPKKRIPRPHNKTGTEIIVPMTDRQAWVSKDLADCTGEDFVAWASEVYPISLEVNSSKYDSLAARVHTFKDIMAYHMNSPFQMGRNKERNTTRH